MSILAPKDVTPYHQRQIRRRGKFGGSQRTGVITVKFRRQPTWPSRGRVEENRPPCYRGSYIMSFLGNILWLIFGGLVAGCGYLIAGLLLCLTIVGIPFGMMAIRIGFATFAPFGKEVVERPHANSPLRVVFNLIWILLFGWEIANAHLTAAKVCAMTIIGIPFALQHLKLVPLSLLPFGRDLK